MTSLRLRVAATARWDAGSLERRAHDHDQEDEHHHHHHHHHRLPQGSAAGTFSKELVEVVDAVGTKEVAADDVLVVPLCRVVVDRLRLQVVGRSSSLLLSSSTYSSLLMEANNTVCPLLPPAVHQTVT